MKKSTQDPQPTSDRTVETETVYEDTQPSKSSGLSVVQILWWLCVAAALWFAYLNINPYAQAVRFILGTIADNSLVRGILALPLLGSLFAFTGIFAHWIIGFVLWAVIQTIEVLPIILRHDRAFLRTVLSHHDQSHRVPLSSTDNPTLKALKLWYNRFPLLAIAKARRWRKLTYAIDFLICIIVYPPAASFSTFLFLIFTGQWSALDWANIALLVVTLLAIEVIVELLLWIGQIVFYYRSSAEYR